MSWARAARASNCRVRIRSLLSTQPLNFWYTSRRATPSPRLCASRCAQLAFGAYSQLGERMHYPLAPSPAPPLSHLTARAHAKARLRARWRPHAPARASACVCAQAPLCVKHPITTTALPGRSFNDPLHKRRRANGPAHVHQLNESARRLRRVGRSRMAAPLFARHPNQVMLASDGLRASLHFVSLPPVAPTWVVARTGCNRRCRHACRPNVPTRRGRPCNVTRADTDVVCTQTIQLLIGSVPCRTTGSGQPAADHPWPCSFRLI